MHTTPDNTRYHSPHDRPETNHITPTYPSPPPHGHGHPDPQAHAWLNRPITPRPTYITTHAAIRAHERFRGYTRNTHHAHEILTAAALAATYNPYPHLTPPAAAVYEALWTPPGRAPVTISLLVTPEARVLTALVRRTIDQRPFPQRYTWNALMQAFEHQPPPH